MFNRERVALDPALRRVLQTARSWGVSPSRFLGSVHTMEWTENDRALAMALVDYEADLCGSCGGNLHETTDPENEGRYVATAPIRCHRCTAVAQARKVYEDTTHPEALMIPVELHRGE